MKFDNEDTEYFAESVRFTLMHLFECTFAKQDFEKLMVMEEGINRARTEILDLLTKKNEHGKYS